MKYNNYIELFDSPAQMCRTIGNRPLNEQFFSRKDHLASEKNSKEITGTESYKDATDLLLNGDTENLKIMESVKLPKSIGNSVHKKAFEASVCGCSANVPAFISGQPKSMFALKRKPSNLRTLNLIINNNPSFEITVNQLAESGAKVAGLVSSLENKGIRVNLHVGTCAEKKGQKIFLFTRIKRAEAPLNKLALAYPIINASFVRRHYFKWLETLPVTIRTEYTYSYGIPKTISRKDKEITEKFGKECVCINLLELINGDISINRIINDITND